MHHRHLLPNEIDLLVDEETGFGVQPLREHVLSCDSCRAQLEDARQVASSLSNLHLLAPRVGLADRVMTRVPVFVPWHVAARDTLRHWMPTGPAARAAAAVIVAVVGSLVTGLTLWIATRGDIIASLSGLLGEGARGAVARTAGDLVVALFGRQVFDAVQLVGPLGIGLAAGGFLISSVATVVGLRRIATTSGRTRS